MDIDSPKRIPTGAATTGAAAGVFTTWYCEQAVGQERRNETGRFWNFSIL
jgi:hypothetical protein